MVTTSRLRTQHDSPRKNRLIGAILGGQNVTTAARMMGMPRSTASDIWKKYNETGTTQNRRRSGRPKKVRSHTERAIVREALQNRRKTFANIGNDQVPKLSESTVQKVLARHNYRRCVARRVPFLTTAQKKQRMRWAREYKGFTKKDWSRVIFSDECYIVLDDRRGRIYVTRNPTERDDENCVVGMFTQSPVRVMVWGCVMKGKKGPLVVLEYPGGPGGGFNGARYKAQVLERFLKGFYAKMSKKRGRILFQQDGAPAHRRGFVKEWFRDQNIPLLFHPAASPDLNPIEPVWHELKKIIRALPQKPGTVAKLEDAIIQAWKKLPRSDIDKHVGTMQARVRAVLNVRGGHTRY